MRRHRKRNQSSGLNRARKTNGGPLPRVAPAAFAGEEMHCAARGGRAQPPRALKRPVRLCNERPYRPRLHVCRRGARLGDSGAHYAGQATGTIACQGRPINPGIVAPRPVFPCSGEAKRCESIAHCSMHERTLYGFGRATREN
ncbi:hypothetical protein MRX96_045189 [Rhipicephalus microplus]